MSLTVSPSTSGQPRPPPPIAEKPSHGTITCNLASYLWTVDDFPGLPSHHRPPLESPLFTVHHGHPTDFHLELHPHGDAPERRDHASLFLRNRQPFAARMRLRLALLDRNWNKINSASYCEVEKVVGVDGEQQQHLMLRLEANARCGSGRFIERSRLLDPAAEILNEDGGLRVLVEFSSTEEQVNYCDNEVEVTISRLGEFNDYEALLFNEASFTDFAFVVEGQRMPVHKCLLSRRSIVFRAMFEHGLVEDEVVIRDVRAPIMRELLRFVYVGKMRDVGDCVLELLEGASKYGVEGAKLLCERELCRGLDNANAVEYLRLAYRWEAEELRNGAVEYIKRNTREIVDRVDFQTIAELDEVLFYDILRTDMMSRGQ